MAKDTKNRILEHALVLFSENGYRGTNLRELAASLNLSKSGLYRHFESKEHLWNTLMDRMEDYYTEHFGSAERLPLMPRSCAELYEMTMSMIRFTVHDPQIILTRKLLLTEQFRDERAKRLAARHFLEGTRAMYAKIFASMMDAGLLKRSDPEMTALAFTAPVTVLIHECDREPENEARVMAAIDAFVKQFISEHEQKA